MQKKPLNNKALLAGCVFVPSLNFKAMPLIGILPWLTGPNNKVLGHIHDVRLF